MRVTVCYYDLQPLDPQDRFELRSETMDVISVAEAEDIYTNSGKEVVDVEILTDSELPFTSQPSPAEARDADTAQFREVYKNAPVMHILPEWRKAHL